MTVSPGMRVLLHMKTVRLLLSATALLRFSIFKKSGFAQNAMRFPVQAFRLYFQCFSRVRGRDEGVSVRLYRMRLPQAIQHYKWLWQQTVVFFDAESTRDEEMSRRKRGLWGTGRASACLSLLPDAIHAKVGTGAFATFPQARYTVHICCDPYIESAMVLPRAQRFRMSETPARNCHAAKGFESWTSATSRRDRRQRLSCIMQGRGVVDPSKSIEKDFPGDQHTSRPWKREGDQNRCASAPGQTTDDEEIDSRRVERGESDEYAWLRKFGNGKTDMAGLVLSTVLLMTALSPGG